MFLAYFREQAGKTLDSGCVAALEAVIRQGCATAGGIDAFYRKSLTL
jgi:hypothetical protein